jgi:hypothetical protein
LKHVQCRVLRVTFEVLTAVEMSMLFLRVVTPFREEHNALTFGAEQLFRESRPRHKTGLQAQLSEETAQVTEQTTGLSQ